MSTGSRERTSPEKNDVIKLHLGVSIDDVIFVVPSGVIVSAESESSSWCSFRLRIAASKFSDAGFSKKSN